MAIVMVTPLRGQGHRVTKIASELRNSLMKCFDPLRPALVSAGCHLLCLLQRPSPGSKQGRGRDGGAEPPGRLQVLTSHGPLQKQWWRHSDISASTVHEGAMKFISSRL